MKILVTVLILLTGFIACEDSNGSLAGPCVHYYLDPLIVIDAVSDEGSGKVISQFKIIGARLNNQTMAMHFLVNDVSFNSVLYDSVLFCNTPCGFGSEEGAYRLTVASPGYRDTTIAIDAHYKNFKGGCPSSNSGSTVLSFTMKKL